MTKIKTGAWRDQGAGPMQVVSGAVGKERVHFEAPKADRLKREMTAFLKWFEGKDAIDPVLKAGLAHLWLVTIHPFEDGNGRIARAIADMALARSEHSSQRFYSMSAQIKVEHKKYYDILEGTQKGTMNVTDWMVWFLDCLGRAIDLGRCFSGLIGLRLAALSSRLPSGSSGVGSETENPASPSSLIATELAITDLRETQRRIRNKNL